MDRKIILTVLSTFQKNNDNVEYDCMTGNPITAKWTNEAGLKYLLKEQAEYTDIIFFCSKETDNKEYKNRVHEIIESEYKGNLTSHFITYSVKEDINSTINHLTHDFEFKPSDTVYIDTTGGFRTVVYAVTYLLRYFEYMGVKVESAIYSSCDSNIKRGKISDIKDTFRMFTLINGAHEFTSTGNPHTLTEYFSDTKSQTIRNLLDSMQQFYDNISLCRIGDEFEESWRNMKDAISRAESSRLENDEKRLQELLPAIHRKLFPERKSKYLGLIKWCLENNLLQQAITIYVEKMPKAYFTELGFLTADFETLEKKSTNPGTEIHVGYFITACSDNTTTLNDQRQKYLDMLKNNENYIRINKKGRTRIKIKVEKELEALLEIVLKFRDMFYDDNGHRLPCEPTGKKEKQLLEKTFKQFTAIPKTIVGLLNETKRFIPLAYPDEKTTKTHSPLKSLEGVRKGIVDDNVTCNISNEILLKLRLDYLYMKYIRNQINHASETETYSTAYKESLSKINPELYVFPDGNNFSAEDIRKFIRQSVEYIENINCI